MSRKTGNLYEHIACQYLLDKNLKLITKNYSCKQGEIDLILLDKYLNEDIIIFTEVRYRTNDYYGHPIESINYKKREKLKKAAYNFIINHPNYKNTQYRFDVVTILGRINAINLLQETEKLNIQWFKNIITY